MHVMLSMNSIKFISQCRIHFFRDTNCLLISHYLKSRLLYTSSANNCAKISEDKCFLKNVIYNEVLQNQLSVTIEKDSKKTEPIVLKYLMEDNKENDQTEAEDVENKKEIVHFPYEVKDQNDENGVVEPFIETIKNTTPSDENLEIPKWAPENFLFRLEEIEKPRKWAFEEEKMKENNEFEDVFKFGSFNPNMRVSSVPCGGCGALLHCNNPKLPGFLPAEVFEIKKTQELFGEKCQRCHFLEKFDIPLGIQVSPSEYEKLIKSIRDNKALAVIMIDILDFPCSIFPGIMDLIGPTKPVVIVANKVDLLIQEDSNCIHNFKKSLIWLLKKQKFNLQCIKHIALISAKTGYGVEKLIDVLHSNWGNKGDIYLIGCTNVGKSTLFNTLIQSDFCKVKAINIMQRATVSAWPGTTLNLLKFPIMRPSKWRLMMRTRRLASQMKEEVAFKKYECLGRKIQFEQIPLKEYVGNTFLKIETPEDLDEVNTLKDTSNDKKTGINPHLQDFARGYWFYDTPGVVNQDQIVNYLTASELLLTVPNKMLLPRTFQLTPGHTLFIAGLARLDYISGPNQVWFTVYASMKLPITVTKTKNAEHVYQKFLGTPYFRVPVEGKERLAKWPSLSSKKLEIEGKFVRLLPQRFKIKEKLIKETDADIVLSSAGWVSVTVPSAYRCKCEAWTPRGKGIHLRDIPMIKWGYTFRGPRIPGTPAFQTVMKEVEGTSITDEPTF